MKIVHLNSSDSGGGASIACRRISDSLKSNGIDSKVLVQNKKSQASDVSSIIENPFSKISYYLRFFLDESYIRLFTVQSRGRFSNPSFGTEVLNHQLIQEADVINLHWVNGGFLSLQSINKLKKLGKPIVWTLHDMWAFTGGCHYNLGCDKFLISCSNCPSLRFSGKNDLSSKIFKKKKDVYSDLNLTIVTCSKWLAEESGRSELLKDKKIENIPNPVDPEIYKPINKIEAGRKLNLPDDKFIILFGSMNTNDERKGLKYLLDSLNLLLQKHNELKDKIELVVFGSVDSNLIEKVPFKVNSFGSVKSESEVVHIYNSADIYVAPSLQDNLPNTVLESTSCGTPVVAFNVGGIPDMINHKMNGYLAELKSVDDLTNGILWFFNNQGKAKEFSDNARQKAIENFSPQLIGKRYFELYKSLI